ncbi:MAG: hypothetical protein AB1394_13415 [Bacteroidota bacterium]
MIKILKPVVERYLTPKGVLCLPKTEVDFTKEHWNEIPDHEKVLFEDKPAAINVEEANADDLAEKKAEDSNG